MARKKMSYHYLLRFVVTLSLALLIPVLLFFFIIVDTSYKQMTQNINGFYADITDSFYVYFENELTSMRTQAFELSIRSSTRENGTFNTELLQTNPYHYLKVVEYIARMTTPYKPYDVFLYYRDMGHVYSAQYKYDLDGFLDKESGRNEEARMLMAAFFASDSAEQVFCSTFSALDLRNAALYVGTPIPIGINGAPGMLIFKMRCDAVNASMFSTQNAYVLDLCVMGSDNTLLFANSYGARRFLLTDAFRNVLSHDSANAPLSLDGAPYTLFRAQTPPGHAREYITALPRDAIDNEIYSFYIMMRRGTILILSLLAVLLCATVYINYTPIRRLVKRVNPSGGGGEIRAIENAIDRMESELVEKDVLVMNFLISNLLYGVPIPAEEAARHGLDDHQNGVCVMLMPGVTFNNQTREALSNDIAARFQTKAFITDMLYEDYTVAICLLHNAEATAVQSHLQAFLSDGETEWPVYAGEVVESLNEIQSSYKSCLRLMKRGAPKKSSDKANNLQQKLKEDIMSYIDTHFIDPQLNQPTVSDHFGLSVYSLSRFFKEHMGIGFSEYITGKRIAHAKELLVTTDMSVSAVAQAVGIDNINYFSRLFKSYCGMPPLTYRLKISSDK